MGKSIAVLGLGRYGRKIVEVLSDSDVDVMIADKNESLVSQYSDTVTYAMVGDLSSAETLQGIGLEHMDVVIVDMAKELQASIMSVMVAKELGVELVIAKASTHRIGQILTRIGADEIVYPEEESGLRMAYRLTSESFLDFFDLGGNLCIVEIGVRKDWVGQSLRELNLRSKYGLNVVAIKEEGKAKSHFDPNTPLPAEANLLVIIDHDDLERLEDKI